MKEQLIIYPEFDERIGRDFLYTVSVTQGDRTERLPVYNHTEDSRVNRNPVDGRRADEYRRFCTFACLGGVRVDIRVNRDFHDYAVIPGGKAFPPQLPGRRDFGLPGTVRTTLPCVWTAATTPCSRFLPMSRRPSFRYRGKRRALLTAGRRRRAAF